jgi:hypothetical protein
VVTKWEQMGEAIGAAFAEGLKRTFGESVGDRIRAHYAAKYGTCRRCAAPLGGPSTEQICEECYVDETLGALGGGPAGEA